MDSYKKGTRENPPILDIASFNVNQVYYLRYESHPCYSQKTIRAKIHELANRLSHVFLPKRHRIKPVQIHYYP